MWTSITIADLRDTKVSALVEACRTAALGAGQSDPVPNIIANVVARIRAEVAGCSKNSLDADTAAIPADLKSLACRMIVREAMSRLQQPLNDDEREEQRNDLRYLERIARCEVPVAATDTPASGEVQSGSRIERVGIPTRVATREKLAGL
jgi:phage gp36-like protein